MGYVSLWYFLVRMKTYQLDYPPPPSSSISSSCPVHIPTAHLLFARFPEVSFALVWQPSLLSIFSLLFFDNLTLAPNEGHGWFYLHYSDTPVPPTAIY